MKNWTAVVLLSFFSFLGADQSLDTDFLEWLGQTSEIEELGVNVESMIEELENPKELKRDHKDGEAEQ